MSSIIDVLVQLRAHRDCKIVDIHFFHEKKVDFARALHCYRPDNIVERLFLITAEKRNAFYILEPRTEESEEI